MEEIIGFYSYRAKNGDVVLLLPIVYRTNRLLVIVSPCIDANEHSVHFTEYSSSAVEMGSFAHTTDTLACCLCLQTVYTLALIPNAC